MKRLVTLLTFVLAFLIGPAIARCASPAPITVGEIQRCPTFLADARCRPIRLEELRLSAPETTLTRIVTIAPQALPLSRPLMVSVVAAASSEVRWNGEAIGRNGRPGPDRAHERPGRFIATFVVPQRLVMTGPNVASARMSAHHLSLPLRRPVQVFRVGPYETAALPGLRAYLPALLALGALSGAGIYFAVAAALDRRERGALLLALIAGSTVLQLVAETARTFVAYSYPWHVARVAAIAVLAALTATLVAAYSARRFAPAWQRAAVGATAGAAIVSVGLVPWFDIKALGAVLAGTAAMAFCAGKGMRDEVPRAGIALAVGLSIMALMLYQRTEFLDRAYYLAFAVSLVALAAEQVSILQQTRRGRDAEELRADSLQDRLSRASRATGERIIELKDGTRTHRVPEADILFAKAADDYCEVQLQSGRNLLVTTTLARLHASLPDGFVRVHKSYVVGTRHVAMISPRPGGGRLLRLTDGSSVPVGRSYGTSIVQSLACETPADKLLNIRSSAPTV